LYKINTLPVIVPWSIRSLTRQDALPKTAIMKRHALIIAADDDPDDVESSRRPLPTGIHRQACTQSAMAKNCFEFLDARPSDELPSLILLDYKMPMVTGPKYWKSSRPPHLRPIPKVVWSTSGRSKDIQECQRLGAAATLESPLRKKKWTHHPPNRQHFNKALAT